MKIFKKIVSIYLYKLVLVFLGILTLIFGYSYFDISDPKISGLFGGLTAGIFVALIQLLFSWYEHVEIETLKKIGIKEILPHRDKKELYEIVIASARKEVLVMGNTAYRFLEDFANDKREDKRALLDVLSRYKVQVRFLLPDKKYLTDRDEIRKSEESSRKLEELKKNNPTLSYKYYDHAPFHNLVLADDNCLVGPIFPNVSSKDCPAIYTERNSVFIKPYLKYFDYEWDRAHQ